jgi:hypothetical protein
MSVYDLRCYPLYVLVRSLLPIVPSPTIQALNNSRKYNGAPAGDPAAL